MLDHLHDDRPAQMRACLVDDERERQSFTPCASSCWICRPTSGFVHPHIAGCSAVIRIHQPTAALLQARERDGRIRRHGIFPQPLPDEIARTVPRLKVTAGSGAGPGEPRAGRSRTALLRSVTLTRTPLTRPPCTLPDLRAAAGSSRRAECELTMRPPHATLDMRPEDIVPARVFTGTRARRRACKVSDRHGER